ncbi:threonine-phosphate decarboxylase CobD [Minwuia sp. IMCC3060]|uniref:threonine-phosphate decarboxylase CobD n=1 Tax=Minwuia sp. IMCC3060 TaxID=3040675 RepID=UPI002479749F|nr:threonine-phosphate decarboxylase CobD [Minwuia sp. IMCC3060]
MAQAAETRAHGGDLDRAAARYGGSRAQWIDLSTGINPHAWPLQQALQSMPGSVWQTLPDHQAQDRLLDAARRVYGLHPSNGIVAAPGTQALIQLMPRLASGDRVAVRHPSYNEHRGVFADAGWQVTTAPDVGTVVCVNPNNPDGHRTASSDLIDLAVRVGTLIVDEAFMDMTEDDSLCRLPLPANVVVLRSFGKFFGLAGLRLGFAVGAPETMERISRLLGPWAVAGPTLHLGAAALNDHRWIAEMKQTLSRETLRLREMLASAGLDRLSGTDLFQTAEAPDAAALHETLARARIWTRIFDDWPDHIRFGLPASDAAFGRLEQALSQGVT